RRGGVRDRGRVAPADPAVVEKEHVETLGEAGEHRLPAPTGVPEAANQEQRLPCSAALPGDLHAAASSGRGSRRGRSPRNRARGLPGPPGAQKTRGGKSARSIRRGS